MTNAEKLWEHFNVPTEPLMMVDDLIRFFKKKFVNHVNHQTTTPKYQ